MSVGVLLMTHPGIGSSLLHSAVRVYGKTPMPLRCVEVPIDVSRERITQRATQFIQQLDQGQGVLVLTDVYGATPDNIARSLIAGDKVSVLAGLNLPMLLRVFNYPTETLPNLFVKAIEGGTRGVYSDTQENSDA